jgi:hypothetical protein
MLRDSFSRRGTDNVGGADWCSLSTIKNPSLATRPPPISSPTIVLWILARHIALESVREDWRCLKHRAEMHPAVKYACEERHMQEVS